MPLSNALDKVLITRTVGIEPTFTGLESVALPLYYARNMQRAVSLFTHLTKAFPSPYTLCLGCQLYDI